jgi:hypothetical protein
MIFEKWEIKKLGIKLHALLTVTRELIQDM